MFEQDYGMDDELSGDDGRRSPRGAAGFAARAADFAERRIAAGREPMDFGGRRRGERAPFGGDAFGVAPKERQIELDCEHLDGEPREKVSELRDFSSRLWRAGGTSQSAAGSHDTGRRSDNGQDRELAMLTGSAFKRQKKEEAPPSDSSSSSSSKKKKKKEKKKKVKRAGKLKDKNKGKKAKQSKEKKKTKDKKNKKKGDASSS
eukprot:TRINITY_DN114866_c0_g1_i1.p1 TRINITY_DN114866_c0_g1~~TRINITY_DN114866_c0_g1_i1.p1  ORF type:complete len:204 (-),score=68.01 TRINITY_DN114866_c0_g1_i1:50-661(-)